MLPIWVKYEHIGVQFEFQNKDWADAQNPIVTIKFFNKTKDQTDCTLCLKSIRSIDHDKLIQCE